MIGLIAGFLVKRAVAKGVGMTLPHARRLAKVGLAVVAVVLLIIAVGVTVLLIRQDAVDDHESGRIEQALDATNDANANDGVRAEARAASEAEIDTRLDEIEQADPASTTRPASAGSRAVANRLPKGN